VNTPVVILGVGIIFTAFVGGNVKVGSIDLRQYLSGPRQVLVAMLGVAVIGLGAFVHPSDGDGGSGTTTTTSGHNSTTTSRQPTTTSTTSKSTGPWSAQRGDLTLTVTEVENQGGHLVLHASAKNDSAGTMDLPLFGNFVATDNTGHTYQAADFSSDWPITVPSGVIVSGTIELSDLAQPGATSLDASFATVFGQFAPPGGITVKGIRLPDV
jgi:hypothetical protein